MTDAEFREEFYSQVKAMLGFDKERIIKILSRKFKGFHKDKLGEYMTTLRLEKNREDNLELEQEKPMNIVPYPLCPICGAQTYPELKLYGKYTKTPGWTCEQGGREHYYMWRVNRMRERNGESLVFEETHPEAAFPHQSVIPYHEPLEEHGSETRTTQAETDRGRRPSRDLLAHRRLAST